MRQPQPWQCHQERVVPRVVCEVLLAQESPQRSRERKEKSLGASQKLAHPVMHNVVAYWFLVENKGIEYTGNTLGLYSMIPRNAWGCFFLQQAQLS